MASISRLHIARTNPEVTRTRIYRLLLAVCFAFLVPYPMLSSAWGAFPFVDVNNNGVYDPGVDSGDITAQILDDGIFYTSESLVIPTGVKGLTAKNGNDFVLIAEKNITVNAELSALQGNARILLIAKNGAIYIGERAKLNAAQLVKLDAQGDIILGSRSSLNARSRGIGMVMLRSEEGSILAMDGSDLYAVESLSIVSEGGDVSVLPRSKLRTFNSEGRVLISAAGNVNIDRSDIYGELVRVITKASLLDFQNNLVQVPRDGGLVFLFAHGSTVDVSGTQFRNLDSNDLIIRATTVVP